ncbi:hypothetical protein EDC40_10692 [Aminobacter aminovorans]|uniref:Transmembrane protein n=1 Tax=Aminobacter aminovorans TaxID=83263 RepID=A0A380WD72_AMIAI|nr:hypothetical protein [Aminobacter aminovorans]TCS25299.1 hypothetical protein EDC40_10692 [Aminobacter aminovorans]SUU86949.1 Uncharacterised protein [Aminobacter aminovorans]
MSAENEPSGWDIWRWLPVAWLCLVMALSARGIDASTAIMLDFSMPAAVTWLIYASVAFSAVTIAWGVHLLVLAYNRDVRFPRNFTIWQWTIIVFLVLKQIYILVMPDFAFGLVGLAWDGGEIVIGLAMIWLVGRRGQPSALLSNAERERPRLLVSVVAAIIGVIVGAALGAGLGLAVGSAISEITDMSCFEGACGYFVVLLGLGGLIVGAVAGGIFAVWRVNRRKQKPAGRPQTPVN